MFSGARYVRQYFLNSNVVYGYATCTSAERARARRVSAYREAWSRLQCWVSRAVAARSTQAELEAALEHLLRQRERARLPDAEPDAHHLLAYLRDAIADTQAQIMQIEVTTTLFPCRNPFGDHPPKDL